VRFQQHQLRFLAGKLRQEYVWRRIFVERLTEPLHLNFLAALVWIFGSFRARVAFDLVLRHHHAYGILKAADDARALGLKRVTLLEFGVATGTGLLNMASIASRVTSITDVHFDIIGFDTGRGMPPPKSFRDHPELFQAGDFVMNVKALTERLPSNAKLVLGDIVDTVPEFIRTLQPSAPIGFVSLDLDYYYSTKDALSVFSGPADRYLPRTCVYVDDIEGDSYNQYCGALLAVAEFNDEQALRKLDRSPFVQKSRVFQRAPWIDHIYTLHVLDHPTRNTLVQGRERLSLLNPYLSDS
jgi:hypothetical protein